jgi:co-chaperonin GroES (HSP10)
MTTLAKMKVPQPESIIHQDMDDAFPDVQPGETPCGSLVLLQIKRPATKTKSGFQLSGYDMETEFDNTKIAKVIALGPIAYHSRTDGKPWPEGPWVKVGDFIRISQHNVGTWTVPMPGTRGATIEDRITFGLMEDHYAKSIVDDPLKTKAFF